MGQMEEIVKNNIQAQKKLDSLCAKLGSARKHCIDMRKEELRQEIEKKRQLVEEKQNELIRLETAHGKTQYAIPCSNPLPSKVITAAKVATVANDKPKNKGDVKKTVKPKATQDSPAPPEAAVDVGRLDLRIGRIIEVSKHPDADSLYVEKIDCAEATPRTVVSGLVKHVPIEEMKDRLVVVLCNLKPAKMRGVTSEAMVMCASSPDKVEILIPPVSAIPGDIVHCKGFERQPDAQLNPKKKVFETCAPDLMTNDRLEACYKGVPLHVLNKGSIVSKTLKNVNVK